MKLLTILALFGYASAIQIAQENDEEAEFSAWAAKFNRNYKNQGERDNRKKNWLNNNSQVNKVNQNKNNAFKAGHNNFSDWDRAEYLAILGDQSDQLVATLAQVDTQATATVFADASQGTPIDWLAQSAPIADQGQCGSCWAFATAGALEIQNAITNPSAGVLKFSEQHILDCNSFRYDCNGGVTSRIVRDWMAPSLIRSPLASVYPYVGYKQRCNTKRTRTKYYPISQTTYTQTGSPAAYRAGLQTGPVVIRVAADTSQWQWYDSGVLNDAGCFANLQLNHAVVIVGEGVDATSSLPYWLIRNSWGTYWGEAGYIRLAITDSGNGICGDAIQGWNIAMKQF